VRLLRGGDGNDAADTKDEAHDVVNDRQHNDITETLLVSDEMDTSSSTALLEPETQQQPTSSSMISSSSSTTAATTRSSMMFPSMTIVINVIRQWSSQYTRYLQQYPIRTKSITAGLIFALSDLMAQVLTNPSTNDNNDHNDSTVPTIVWSRTLSSAAVGLLYFGPAAHYWYNWMFRILPSTNLLSTIQKAILGQLFFGPSFTCIFFAISLIQSRTFTISHWFQKIRNDLPSAWMAGAGYWPIVDLISYSYIPPQYIPLFVNVCSFFWTTYLVVKSYK
jgi:hypothetical protein